MSSEIWIHAFLKTAGLTNLRARFWLIDFTGQYALEISKSVAHSFDVDNAGFVQQALEDVTCWKALTHRRSSGPHSPKFGEELF